MSDQLTKMEWRNEDTAAGEPPRAGTKHLHLAADDLQLIKEYIFMAKTASMVITC